MDGHPFDAISETSLRKRQSAKWRYYPKDVLPAWVAEMDYPIADPIRRVLTTAIADDDVGYATSQGLGEAFAPWAERNWNWKLEPNDVHLVVDVVTAISELLRVATKPGDRVVIDPPVYAPFASTIRELGRVVVEAPLARSPKGWALDLDAIERAYASGARTHIVCSPQNPTGSVFSAENLAALATLAERHGVLLISDEIHAPMTYRSARHRPLPCVSPAGNERAIVLMSASKSWNLAGLKAAMIVGTSATTRAIVGKLPPETPYHAGHLGVLAARAAFLEGDPWLASTTSILERNAALLGELLRERLPEIRYVPPQASYLAWLDCSELGVGDDPSNVFLRHGKVALSAGPSFGTGGAKFARLNFATTRTILVEAVDRMAKAVRAFRS